MRLMTRRRERKLRSTLTFLRYWWINRRATRRVPASGNRLIFSLTTHPPRIHQVFATLESLCRQDLDAFDVHLYLSRRDYETIGRLPDSLVRLTQRGVQLVITEEDYRSYDKLVHALRAHPDATIITADDDVMYPRRWARQLLEGAKRYPGCVVCHRGHMLCESAPGSGRISYDIVKNRDDQRAMQPNIALMPTGNGGVLYPPGALDEMVLDADAFRELAPDADDIWFKMAALKAGTRCVRLSRRNTAFAATPAARESALSEDNIKRGGNDRQFANCLARYPELAAMIFGTAPAPTGPIVADATPQEP